MNDSSSADPGIARRVMPTPTASRRLQWLGAFFLSWTALVALMNIQILEPLTGAGWGVYLRVVAVMSGLGGLSGFALHRRMYVVGAFIALVALVLVVPLPSRPGVVISVQNETSERVEVVLVNPSRPHRPFPLIVKPRGVSSHRTAAGDFSEAIQVVAQAGTNRVTAAIGQFRTNLILLGPDGLMLVGKDIR